MTDTTTQTPRIQIESVVQTYASDLRNAIGNLSTFEVATAINLITATLAGKRTVFVVGNGGSASTAQHMAADLCAAWAALGNTGSVVCLNDNTARWSALVNDAGPEEAFAGQLRFLGNDGDLLIVMSVSAESRNLIAACQTARELGIRTLALIGRQGALAEISDLSVEFGNGDYGLAEDLHLWFNHCLARYLRGGAHRYNEDDRAVYDLGAS